MTLAFVLTDCQRHLPEYQFYRRESPELAGDLTRKEVGVIAEILTLAALRAGKNVLVDGSLRNSKWYQNYFAKLKQDFPWVRQAIIHVKAPREAVFKRAEVRGPVDALGFNFLQNTNEYTTFRPVLWKLDVLYLEQPWRRPWSKCLGL